MSVGWTFTAEIVGDTLQSYGTDWGKPLEILFRNGKKLVVRRKGHSAWGGRFSPADYTPTIYMIVELSKERVPKKASFNGKAFTRDVATVIVSIEPGRKWKAAVEDLIEQAKR